MGPARLESRLSLCRLWSSPSSAALRNLVAHARLRLPSPQMEYGKFADESIEGDIPPAK